MSVLALGTAMAITSGGASAPPPGPPEDPMVKESKTRTVADYVPLPAKAVGVVVQDPRAVLASEHRLAPPRAAAFCYGGGRNP